VLRKGEKTKKAATPQIGADLNILDIFNNNTLQKI